MILKYNQKKERFTFFELWITTRKIKKLEAGNQRKWNDGCGGGDTGGEEGEWIIISLIY